MRRLSKLNLWNKYFSKREQRLLLLLLLFGLVVRIATAVMATMVWDEGFSFFIGRRYDALQLLLGRYWDSPVHPPLYYIFLHFWEKICSSLFFLRLPGIITSFFSLYFIPILAKSIYPSLEYFPFFTLFLYVFSQSAISLDVAARPYFLVIFFLIISLILFFKFINNQKNITTKNIIIFSVINAAGFLTDYSFIWLLASYGMFLLIDGLLLNRKNRRLSLSVLLSLLVTLLISSFWIKVFIINFHSSLSMISWLKEIPFYKNIQDLTGVWIPNPFLRYISIFFIIAISYLSLIFLFFKNNRKGLFLLIAVTFSSLASYVFSIFYSPIFLARNLNIVILVIIISLGLFLSFLLRHRGKFKYVLLFFFFIFWFKFFLSVFPSLPLIGLSIRWNEFAKTMIKHKTRVLFSRQKNWYFPVLKYYLYLFTGNDNLEILNPEEFKNNRYILHIVRRQKIVFFMDNVYSIPEEESVFFYANWADYLNCDLKNSFSREVYFGQCTFP